MNAQRTRLRCIHKHNYLRLHFAASQYDTSERVDNEKIAKLRKKMEWTIIFKYCSDAMTVVKLRAVVLKQRYETVEDWSNASFGATGG